MLRDIANRKKYFAGARRCPQDQWQRGTGGKRAESIKRDEVRTCCGWCDAQGRAAQVERGELYTHDKFFKETQTNHILHEAIETTYPVGQETPESQE